MPLPMLHPHKRKEKDAAPRGRLFGLSGMAVLTAAVYLVGMMRLQIVQGEEYYAQTESSTLSVIPISAARGEILDRDGVALAENRTGLNIVFTYAFFPQEGQAERIRQLTDLCLRMGEDWYDPLPINEDGTAFTEDSDAEVSALRQALSLSVYATAEDCIYQLCRKYAIEYDDPTLCRRIAGVCYGMLQQQFSLTNNRYTFAEDVSAETALQVKELSYILSGVDIAQEDIRSYPDGETAPHIVGTIGLMSAEEWSSYKELGYQMSDSVGKFGIERYCEEILRGTDGERTVEQSDTGELLREEVTLAPQSGNSVVLTISAAFQKRVQEILEAYIEEQRLTYDPEKGGNVKGGAVTVLDAKTGAVLAAVTYPSYDINDYYTGYSELLAADNTPLVNRAFDGLYRPGSTFKTVVATAALEEGIITDTETVDCEKVYTYYDTIIEDNTFHPTCLELHGNLAVRDALTKSCNIFFYDVGRRTGIETINRYANLCGLGTETGLELGSATGTLTSPEHTAALGGSWTQGNVVQASIGQMDTMVSPLQLAVQAMTIGGRGKRYRTYLVDEVRSFDGSELIDKTEPELLSSFEMDEATFQAVKDGMVGASLRLTDPAYSLADLDYAVAIKTGTPQVTTDTTNSAAIAFAPADDAEVAIGIMLEEGTGAARMLRDILLAWEELIRNA